ncbi:MAG: hypothetical protein U0L98_02125 [Clostridia bacterium]|nr:hypothetical protein [Clostridia bacterium]
MSNQTVDILSYVLIFMIVILFVLTVIFVILKIKEKSSEREENKQIKKQKSESKRKDNIEHTKEYTKESIFSFMEFDKIEDNMIIKKENKNYLMVIECQGINYDLMSGVEKTSVEQGFLQFLNTLRHPIQIYTQTRTVNLESSIRTYRDKLKNIQDKLAKVELDYRQKVISKKYTKEELAKFQLEVVKQRNLYEYGLDIIRNTEQMSFNKNILTKQYYIIISYYPEDMDNKSYDKEEIKNLAFSELYTKAQSIISALYVCGVSGKILNSIQLTELLYVAYNRDESEIYDLNKMMNSGYEELYSTAPDVLDKKMKELDRKIELDASRRANDAVFNAVEENEKEKAVKEKERKIESLIDEMAKMIIEQSESTFGQEITEKAKNIIDEEASKKKQTGGKVDEKKEKTTRRNRKTI